MAQKELKLYRFAKANRIVEIEATELNNARVIFQQQHGYWPDKEIIDDDE